MLSPTCVHPPFWEVVQGDFWPVDGRLLQTAYVWMRLVFATDRDGVGRFEALGNARKRRLRLFFLIDLIWF